MVDKSTVTLQLEPRIWPELTVERGQGYLRHTPACYSLWFYYGIGMNVYIERIRDKIYLEGDPEPQTNHKQLFASAAKLYGVEPEEMIRHWPDVDQHCHYTRTAIMLPAYRFAKPALVITG